MEKILRGIMRYRVLDRASMVKQFQEVKDNPTPKAVFYTCMDSRMIPTRFTETSVGDMFVVFFYSEKRGQCHTTLSTFR
uniref:carbonic anhydrase n=1 Tax=Bombyx mori TaxID=7091 RepID=A0A8R2C9W3_BOMMO|nr:beta carbonic anhydrase 1 isoform X3 [Bombyx mori]